MVPNNNSKIWLSPKIVFLTVSIFSNFQNAYADTPDAGTMLANFAVTIPNLMSMVTAIAYVMGMFVIFKGIMGLKQYGEQRTMMSSSHDLKGPLMLMFVGTCLLYLPSSVQVGTSTFWTEPNPYGYVQDNGQDPWSIIIQDSYMIIELIGTIAFIRGLLILSQMGHHGGQPVFGKAMAHIVAGVLCINLYTFIQTINTTLGLGS